MKSAVASRFVCIISLFVFAIVPTFEGGAAGKTEAWSGIAAKIRRKFSI